MPARRSFTARAIIALSLTSLLACGGGGDSTAPNDPVASVTLTPATAQLVSLAETVQLTAAARTQGGSTSNATATWQSSAPQVATVDASGLVRAVANGSAQITATVGTISGTAAVTVQQIAGRVSLTPTRDSIFAGATLQLTASATDRGNAGIASPRATWSSNDTSIAVVSSSGLVTGRKRGQARITVRVDTASAGMDIVIRLTSILASRDTVITGTLQVDRFEVTAGRTVTLAGDLNIRAEGPVTINGTLRGDCRAVDIVSLRTVTVRGTVDNTCTVATATGKSLRLVASEEYTLEAVSIFSSGAIHITNDSTIVPSDTSLGVRRLSLQRLTRAAAPCMLNGAIGLGRTRAAGASGSPKGDPGAYADPVVLTCSGDLTAQGLTVKADHGGDGGDGTTTTPGVDALAGSGGNGGAIVLGSTTKVTLIGASLFAGNGGNGGFASSIPTAAGRAIAFGGTGGSTPRVHVEAPQIVIQGNQTRIEFGKAGNGGDALALALSGADATIAQPAQPGNVAVALAGDGGPLSGGGRLDILGQVFRGQTQNAGNVIFRAPIGGNGGVAEVSPGDGGNSAILQFPHGADAGIGSIEPGSGGHVRLFDNRPGFGFPLGTPGGAGNGVIRRGNGGFGIPDCVLPIFHLGGAGGSGSGLSYGAAGPGLDALNRPGIVGKTEVIDALNGRDGRDGVPPGNGGSAGTLTPLGNGPFLPDVDVGTSRRAGVRGLACPPNTSTNPICDVQLTPQANVIRQISQDVFSGNPLAFCTNATTNVFTGQVVHTVPSIAPTAHVLNQTSFRMVPPRDRVLNHTSFSIVGGGTYPIAAGNADALNTKYPCGQHSNGRTHCVITSPLTAGPHIVVFGIMNGNIPQADPGNLYQYGFVFDRDNNPANNYLPPPQFANDFFKGTDQWYQAQYNPRSAGFSFGATRVVNNGFQTFPTSARLILNGATWFLIVPASEFSVPNPMVRFTSFRHTGNFGLTGDWDGDVQRPIDQPLWSLPIQPSSSPTMRISRPTGLAGDRRGGT